jgi:hypothetical protein
LLVGTLIWGEPGPCCTRIAQRLFLRLTVLAGRYRVDQRVSLAGSSATGRTLEEVIDVVLGKRRWRAS